MKHSGSGSMTDSCEPEVGLPSTGNCKTVLQELYINLCNLIVETRTPRINERGYGDGSHCPPLLGPNTHNCDFSLTECQKHQRLIHHLLQAIECNIFEIEVLVLPECCTEPQLTERIQKKEYLLLERWSMKCINGNLHSTIEVPQLLRAVRSFLHFSQLSAWLSSNKGKSPMNIYYWIKSNVDDSTTKFEQEPEMHSFPICKIGDDLYGSVTVKYPSRTEYVPLIPCCKHPPLRAYSFRTIDDEPRLCPNIPLSPQIVRQLQRTCDTSQSTLTTKSYLSEPAALVLTPASLLKTFATKLSDGKKTNRVLKHSNCQTDLIDASDLALDCSKNKNMDIISKSQTAFVVCNYTETCPNVHSQENVCFNQRQLAMKLHKARLKLQRLNTDKSDLPGYEISTDQLEPPEGHTPVKEIISITEKSSNEIALVLDSNETSRNLTNYQTSPEKDLLCKYHSMRNTRRVLRKRKSNAFKRKQTDINSNALSPLPHKKSRCDINISSPLFKSPSYEQNQKSIPFSQTDETSHIKQKTDSLNSRKSLFIDYSKTEKSNCNSHKNGASEIEFLKQTDCGVPNHLYSSMMPHKDEKVMQKKHTGRRKRKLQVSCEIQATEEFQECINLNNSFIKSVSKETSTYPDIEMVEKKRCKASNKCKFNSDLPCNSVGSVNFTPDNDKNLNSDNPDNISLPIDLNNFPNIVPQKEFALSGSQTCHNKNNSNISKDKFLEVNLSHGSVCKTIDFTDRKRHTNLQKKYFSYQKSGHRNPLPNPSPKSKPLFFCKNVFEKCRKVREARLSKINSKQFKKLFKIASSQEKHEELHSNNSVILNSKQICSSSEKMNNNQMFKNIALKKFRKEKKERSFVRDKKVTKIQEAVIKTKKIENQTESNSASETFFIKQLKNKLSKTEYDTYNSLVSSNRRRKKTFQKHGLKKLCNLKSLTDEVFKGEKTYTASSVIRDENKNNWVVPKMVCNLIPEELSISNSSKLNSEEKKQNHPESCISKDVMVSLQNAHLSASLNKPLGAYRTLFQMPNENLECFPRHTMFPKAKKLLGNFEESLLKGCLPTINSVKGFHAEIGASGSFCPNHLTLPADVHFYELGNPNQGVAPYVAHISLGDAEYYLPKKGAVQVTLFNPSDTVVKVFVLNYDLSNMPPLCHTFIRQKIYYLPVGSTDDHPSSPKWLRFIIHLRFASNKSGKIFLHEDFKIVILNKSNDDAASEFSQEPRELRSFLSVPINPTFSNM